MFPDRLLAIGHSPEVTPILCSPDLYFELLARIERRGSMLPAFGMESWCC